jgi:hypothetical protein
MFIYFEGRRKSQEEVLKVKSLLRKITWNKQKSLKVFVVSRLFGAICLPEKFMFTVCSVVNHEMRESFDRVLHSEGNRKLFISLTQA